MQYLIRMHSMILIECYLCSFDFHLVLVAKVFVILLGDEKYSYI